MWRPASIEEFEAAVADGALEERHGSDAKRQLPSSGKEIAKDIAAMTTDGGMLVYGVGEDDTGQPRVLAPISLAGAAERIEQIAEHSISGTPRIEFVHLRRFDDPATGYLIVLIPASPEAPHQVEVGNDRRFYGRGDTGNRILTEAEIARLYERRQRYAVDREKLLAGHIARSPLGEPTPGEEGFLHAFAEPALPDDGLWDRAVAKRGSEEVLLEDLRRAAGSIDNSRWGGTDLASAHRFERRGADKWSLDTTVGRDPATVRRRATVRADISMDGRSSLFYGGAAERRPDDYDALVVLERGIAITLNQFLALVGALYDAGDLYGPIDVGMAVVGITGGISSFLVGRPLLGEAPTYKEHAALRTARRDARELAADPASLARELSGRLMRAMVGRDFDPLVDEL